MATVTLATLKGDFFSHLPGGQFTSSATGGSTSKLTDSTLANLASSSYPATLVGKQVRITGGSASGDLRLIAREDRTEGDVFPQRLFSAAIANTDTYEIWGNEINGGTPLTNLFNQVLRRLKPIIQTRLTLVSDQDLYNVTTLVDSVADLVRVWERRHNYAVGGDYEPTILFGWHPLRLAAASTPTTWLQLPYARVANTRTQLNGSINAAITTITVDDTSDFPNSGRLEIESELIDYTGTTATTFTGCTRASGTSTAASHADNSVVDLAGCTSVWVEHQSSFTAFTGDSSTVDAVYRDYLAWQAVLYFAWDRALHGPRSERSDWQALAQRAGIELEPLRVRFEPERAIRIHPQRFV